MSKKAKWSLWIASCLLLALAGYVAAGPYLAINGLRRVVASGQYDELWRFVDYDRLRESLRPQLQARIAAGVIQRAGPSGVGTAAGALAARIATPAIDAMVSPQGVATLLTGSALAQRLTGQPAGDGRPRANDPLANAATRFESPSLFTATASSADGKPVVFEFRRNGLAWKLAGLRLPE